MAQTAQEKAVLNGMDAAFSRQDTDNHGTEFGLTKREYFAAMALQAVIQANLGSDYVANPSTWATNAIEYADALLIALEK